MCQYALLCFYRYASIYSLQKGNPMKRMTAQYKGKCWVSGFNIEPGNEIVWDGEHSRAALASQFDEMMSRKKKKRTEPNGSLPKSKWDKTHERIHRRVMNSWNCRDQKKDFAIVLTSDHDVEVWSWGMIEQEWTVGDKVMKGMRWDKKRSAVGKPVLFVCYTEFNSESLLNGSYQQSFVHSWDTEEEARQYLSDLGWLEMAEYGRKIIRGWDK